jgi:hypothetical protein
VYTHSNDRELKLEMSNNQLNQQLNVVTLLEVNKEHETRSHVSSKHILNG